MSSLTADKGMYQLFCCPVAEQVPESANVAQVVAGSLAQGVDLLVKLSIRMVLSKTTPNFLAAGTATTRLSLTTSDVDSGGSCRGLRVMKTVFVFPSWSINLLVPIHAAISALSHEELVLINQSPGLPWNISCIPR